MNIFQYSDEETQFLKTKDPVFGEFIEKIGRIERETIPEMFSALVNSIVGQQISTKALQTIWKRMLDRFGDITPHSIGALSPADIQSCGTSMRKAYYIKEAAEKILNGELDLETLHTLPDNEVCRRLSALKGIGVWTAEMLMIFSMGRKNIMSYDDLAIHRGLRMVYHHRKVDRKLFEKYRRRYSPYGTVACLYLWAIAGGACEGVKDYSPMTPAKKKLAARKRQKSFLIEPQ